jgi:hypothetical protein
VSRKKDKPRLEQAREKRAVRKAVKRQARQAKAAARTAARTAERTPAHQAAVEPRGVVLPEPEAVPADAVVESLDVGAPEPNLDPAAGEAFGLEAPMRESREEQRDASEPFVPMAGDEPEAEAEDF